MKIYYNRNYLIPSSELAILAPFEESISSDERLSPISNDTSNEISEIENCDFVIMPYKWDKNNPNNKKVFRSAKENNKKVLIFYIDDSDQPISVDNSFVFRTSFYKSNKRDYEFAMPCFKVDGFNDNYITNPKLSIGFCGQSQTQIRTKVLSLLKNSDIETNFIIRNALWPRIERGLTKEEVIKEFYENMESNIFNVCMRGGGNFSYRLYETLMMGRIPIIIDTDIVLPFEDLIDWNNHCVIIKDLSNLESDIKSFYENKNLIKIQKSNREMWLEYLSPKGFIKNIQNILGN